MPRRTRGGLGGWLSLLHAGPVAATLLAACLFALLLHRHPLGFVRLAVLLWVVGLSQAAIAVFNDLCDLDLDKRSRPERPIPAGLVSPSAAVFMALFSALGSIALAGRLGPLSLVLVLLGTGAGLAYSAVFKRTIWSWLPFAVAFPLLPAWIAVALNSWSSRLWPLTIIGPALATAVHLADSIPDIEADRRHGAAGLAARLGRRHSLQAALTLVTLGSAVGAIVSLSSPAPIYGVVGAAIGLCLAAVPRRQIPDHGLRYYTAAAALAVSCGWLLSVRT